MTAKLDAHEIAYYAVRGTDRDPVKDVEKVKEMINQYALHIAEQAVEGEVQLMKNLNEAPVIVHIYTEKLNGILSQIKTLIEETK
jgi:hypothetical protein